MLSLTGLILTLALLVVTAGEELENKKIRLNKCCSIRKMLSADGQSCIEAKWTQNFSIKTSDGYVVHPLDSEWMGRWLPPGLPLHYIRDVNLGKPVSLAVVSSVNASSLWDPALPLKDDLRSNTLVLIQEPSMPLYGNLIARPKPGGGFRRAVFCVDAAPPPLGPFAVKFHTYCSEVECARKCCWKGHLLNYEANWRCEYDDEHYWTPNKSSLAVFDPEFPSKELWISWYERLRVLPYEKRYAESARQGDGMHHFHFSTWRLCFTIYRSSNGSYIEGLFFIEFSRITRGVYWLLRPICFLSALLILVSLLSVACDKNMRRKIHGRCLVSHAACLLAFNMGQIGYFIGISDYLDEKGKQDIPPDLQSVCKYFALSMYFMLIAAWFWLTALCTNMARGFRLHKTRSSTGSGKSFLVISAFAWGLPAMLTTTSCFLFSQPKEGKTPPWYTPSLLETRMCYNEPLVHTSGDYEVPFMKSGTALFYYGPVFCLVMCNIVCLALTLRKVQYLKRGNSVLRRDDDHIPLGQRHKEINNPPTAHTTTGNGQTQEGRNRRGITVDAKTIKLYIKIVLLSGGIELLTDVIMWFTTHGNFKERFGRGYKYSFSHTDRDLAYRAAGYVTDFFRAAIVTWLAAPEGGYLGLIVRRLRRGKRNGEISRSQQSRQKEAQRCVEEPRPPDILASTRAYVRLSLCESAAERSPRQPNEGKRAVVLRAL